MSGNHPRRNWRAHMRASLSDWLQTPQARCLVEVPIDPARMQQALQQRLAQAYEAGYAARKDRD